MKLKGLWAFIQEQRSVKTIDLEKVYESFFDESFTIEDIIESKNFPYPSQLLKSSMYVEFLKDFKDKAVVTDDEIKKSRYFKTAWKHIQTYGHYQLKKDETELVQYCRNFLDLYRIFEKKARHRQLNVINATADHYKYGYPLVFKILNSDHSMVWDGHHRLACHYVLKKRFVKVKIMGTRKNAFQARES